MTKYNQDFEMFQGDTMYINVPITDVNGNREPLGNVTEITWAMSSWSDQPAFLTKQYTLGEVEILDDVEGYIRVILDPADTADLNGTYYHEVEFEFSNGDVSTALVGNVRVKDSSTEQ